MASINTNYGALVALQSLTATTKELDEVQNRVNTGLKVSSAKDNGAVFAIAEGQRVRLSSIASVNDGIARGISVIDTALSAGEAIGDILKQMKEKAVAAQATDLSTEQRATLQADFDALRDQIDQIANAATFNGSNLVNGTNLTGGSNEFSVLTSDAAGSSASAYSLDGLPFSGSNPYAASATLATATGLTFDANDAVVFTLTSGSTTTQYSVGVAGTDTIQDFLDAVNTGTNGQVTASYDDTTGVISYSSSSAFSVLFVDTGTTGKDDNGYFDSTDGATGGTLAAGGGGGGSNSIVVSGFDFRLGQTGEALETVTALLDVSTTAGGDAASDAIDTALTALNSNLATLGSQAKALEVQKTFLSKLSDTIESGIGNLVDADLAKESARLQSLQVKQQLGAQALSIANQAPSIVLSFFR
ncbi:MAG: flagellin [Hydrogenophilaceae bacterium]|jgi:flagellin|nr:flagellin [Hydrogenophilaceae bacterium]